MVLNDIIEESFADHSKVIELVRGNLLGNIESIAYLLGQKCKKHIKPRYCCSKTRCVQLCAFANGNLLMRKEQNEVLVRWSTYY